MDKIRYILECAVWEFTLKCNLNCLHCGSCAGKSRDDELDENRALRLCEDLKEAGCLSAALMGGEPLLRKDFWRVARKIRDSGMELSVITNGTLFREDTFRKLSELKPRAVAVSLDAANPEIHDKIRGKKGAFDKTREFIERVLAEKLPVSVITTVHKMNIGELAGLRDMLIGKGVAWQIQTAGAEGQRFPRELLLDEEEFYSVGFFIESTRKNFAVGEMPMIGAHDLGYNSMFFKNVMLTGKWQGCQAGKSVLGIRSNGDFIGCLAINDDRFVEGNAGSVKIKDLWNSPDSFKYSRNFTPGDAGENCRGCEYMAECKGGCCEMSLMKTDKLHNDPYCFHRIEKRLFSRGAKNPLERIRLKLISAKNRAPRPDGGFLKKMFLGRESAGIKINAGCGWRYMEGYLNVDAAENSPADKIMPAHALDFESETADEVLAKQLIEHLGFFKSLFFLAECYRVLKPGGALTIETPDLEKSFDIFLKGNRDERERVLGWIYGNESPGMNHIFCFPPELLEEKAREAGFEVVEKSFFWYQPSRPAVKLRLKKNGSDKNKLLACEFRRFLTRKKAVDFGDEEISAGNERILSEIEKFLGEAKYGKILELAVRNCQLVARFFEFAAEKRLPAGDMGKIALRLEKLNFGGILYGELMKKPVEKGLQEKYFTEVEKWGKSVVSGLAKGENIKLKKPAGKKFKIFSRRMCGKYSGVCRALALKKAARGDRKEARRLFKTADSIFRNGFSTPSAKK